MQRPLSVSLPSPPPPLLLQLPHQTSDEEELLVRQLVEAVDVDEVIERMEMEHYHHLEPIVRSLTSFDHKPRRKGGRPHTSGQQHKAEEDQQQRKRRFDDRPNAPLRSPNGGTGEHRDKHQVQAGRGAHSSLHSVGIISPRLSAREHQPKLFGARDAPPPPPPPPHSTSSDAQTSSAPLDNDHTEKPSLHRSPRRSRSRRKNRLRPPVDLSTRVDMPRVGGWDDIYDRCCDSDKSSAVTLQQQQQQRHHHKQQQQQRRHHSDNRQAPVFGEFSRHSVSRQLELNESYRELSSLRAPSSDMHQRRNQCAGHHYFQGHRRGSDTCTSHGHVTRHALTPPPPPPPPETSSFWRRSSSPPVIAPWSLQPENAAVYRSNSDYWGCMGNGFECTPTATTEEANTPDDLDLDEEESRGYAAVPPRIIEREQHRRRRVADPLPSHPHTVLESPRGGRGSTGEKKVAESAKLEDMAGMDKVDEGRRNDASCDPSFHTHTITPMSMLHKKTKGAVTQRCKSSLSDTETSSEMLPISPVKPAPQDRGRGRSEGKEQVYVTENSPNRRSRSQMLSERRLSTIQSARDDTTSGKQNGQRISPALSPKRQQAPAPFSPLFSSSAHNDQRCGANDNHGNDTKMRTKTTGGNAVETKKKTKNMGSRENPDVRNLDKQEDAKRTLAAPSSSRRSASSYSYSYSSYTASTDLSLSVQSPRRPSAPTATGGRGRGMTPTAVPVSSGCVRPAIGSRVFAPGDLSVYPPLSANKGAKEVRRPLLASCDALQRKHRQGPPPPANPMTVFQPSYNRNLHLRANDPRGRIPSGPSRIADPGQNPTCIKANAPLVCASPAPCLTSSAHSVAKSVQSVGQYVSYLPHSILSPTSARNATHTDPQKPKQVASSASSEVQMDGKIRELVWRTGDSGSVGGSNHKANSATKSMLSSRSVPLEKRGVSSTKENPSPPKNIPMRAQQSMCQPKSSSARRTIEVPSQQTSRHPSVPASLKPGDPGATPLEGSHAAQRLQSHPAGAPTFAIQLPHHVKNGKTATLSVFPVGNQLIQSR